MSEPVIQTRSAEALKQHPPWLYPFALTMRDMTAHLSAVRRLLRLSGSNKYMLVEAFLSLSAASLAIKILPFRKTTELMAARPSQYEPGPAERDRLTGQCRWAVGALADRVPWRAVCFQRGLALHLMLRRRGIRSVLHYGVAQNPEKGLHAHVWIGVGDRLVLGGDEAAEFKCVASFPASSD